MDGGELPSLAAICAYVSQDRIHVVFSLSPCLFHRTGVGVRVSGRRTDAEDDDREARTYARFHDEKGATSVYPSQKGRREREDRKEGK